jgi:hypothetical protein
MHASPRCGARTRAGTPCMSPAVRGKCRCRMHGGAAGSGAPRGNRNAVKHGFYTRAAITARRQLRDLVRQSRKLVDEIGTAQPTVAPIERNDIRAGTEAPTDDFERTSATVSTPDERSEIRERPRNIRLACATRGDVDDLRCGLIASIRGSLPHVRTTPDSGLTWNAPYGRDGPEHKVAALQPAARGREPLGR